MKNNSPKNKLRSFKLLTQTVKGFDKVGRKKTTQSKMIIRPDIAQELNKTNPENRYYQSLINAPNGQTAVIFYPSGTQPPVINMEVVENKEKKKIKDIQKGFFVAGTDINRD